MNLTHHQNRAQECNDFNYAQQIWNQELTSDAERKASAQPCQQTAIIAIICANRSIPIGLPH